MNPNEPSRKKTAPESHERLLAREQAARADAETANRIKDEFLALISHELRTPMTAMLGWMWLLRSETSDHRTKQHALDIIERNMHLQAQIIEDILDVSSSIRGKLRLDARPVQLEPIVQTAVQVARAGAEAKAIRIETAIDAQAASIVILGDPDRLQQALWNLLSNAIKFTRDDGVIRVALRRAENRAEIVISDSGQGIHPDFAPYLFDRFRQGEKTLTRTYRGLGLGLSLVRDIVEMHGGDIRAASEGVDRGATFTITLPMHAGAKPYPPTDIPETPGPIAPTASQRPKIDSSLNGIRILLVEDDPDSAETISVILGKYGARVAIAASVAKALESFCKDRPDVLVSDISMPGEDGYVLIRKVRALGPKRGGDIPAAALTACARPEDRAQVLAAGFQVHIPKPFHPADLAAAILSIMEETKRSRKA